MCEAEVLVDLQRFLSLLNGRPVLPRNVECPAQLRVDGEREWVEIECLVSSGESLIGPSDRREHEGKPLVRRGVARAELVRAPEVLLGVFPVPVVEGVHECQRRVRLGERWIDLERPLSRHLRALESVLG